MQHLPLPSLPFLVNSMWVFLSFMVCISLPIAAANIRLSLRETKPPAWGRSHGHWSLQFVLKLVFISKGFWKLGSWPVWESLSTTLEVSALKSSFTPFFDEPMIPNVWRAHLFYRSKWVLMSSIFTYVKKVQDKTSQGGPPVTLGGGREENWAHRNISIRLAG